jgi:EAL domain-containing protein (putative c-di-GMP-specific phosphodiesterase class I)
VISPAEFIPLAEETGLIVPIGEWVMHTACKQSRAWQAMNAAPVSMAVNVSPRQIGTTDIVDLTGRILRDTGLSPGHLELELTESAVMGSAEAFVGITKALRSLSVKLAIDDFGTGYSSLSYLKRLAVDRLKIDQSFIRDIVHDPDSAAIAVATITLAHSLGLSVIAEGVETEAQLDYLRARGCDEMQGYCFCKPLPAEEIGPRLACA